MTRSRPAPPVASDPLWYKDAIFYELHVRAFADSNADGVGDFRGLAGRMDYLQDLGITVVWLLPFYPSPLKDDGYDISSYSDIHPSYGTLRDFKLFLREAHQRDLRVITELVLNHTSDQHPWFQRARRARPGSAWRDFYVWSDNPDRYKEARIIFKDFEHSNWAWDPVARAYYWHRFYSHQPDLNWENAAVRKAMLRLMDFWLGEVGVDGLRLDAVPYLFEREGTHCENLPETHAALKELRAHVDRNYPDRVLLAEANQWPEDAVAYFGAGDECHTAFHFPLMPRLFMAIRTEDRYPIVDMLEQTPPIPESCQWVLFLRNHDELTLEMVTDEERDYMYRVYARDTRARINLGIRRRLGPLLGNSRAKIELMNGLLLSLPGTPVLYYGDEIGMGDNFYLGDRNGVRTPMQWSPDRNAGFSKANSQQLYLPVIIDPEYHYEAVNVEVQQNNPQSLLWWTKRILALRKRYRAFGRGSMSFVNPDNPKVLAFLRQHEDEHILVVANLSRFPQPAELNLAAFKGRRPVELFGRSVFPPIGEGSYPLTVGGHALYWFSLEPERRGVARERAPEEAELPVVTAEGRWEEALRDGELDLDAVLTRYLTGRRWFGVSARAVQAARVLDAVPLEAAGALVLVEVEYAEGEPETYAVPVACALVRPEDPGAPPPATGLAVIRTEAGVGLLHDGTVDRGFSERLLTLIARQGSARGARGELHAACTRELRKILAESGDLAPSPVRAEQTNSSINYGNQLVLKLVRRVEEGAHPELQLGRFLTERGFPHAAPLLGALEYRSPEGSLTLGTLHRFVPNEGDAWRLTLDHLSRYFERVVAQSEAAVLPTDGLIALASRDLPPAVYDLLGTYVPAAQLIGRRTAELHMALSSDGDDPEFAPEPYSALSQRSLIQSMRNQTRQVLQRLRRRLRDLSEEKREDAHRVLGAEAEILRRTRSAFEGRLTARRIRCHGGLHLGQLLYTGKDFVIIDFEGEPARPLGERRLKRSPLVDVASVIRSFQYVGHNTLFQRLAGGQIRREDIARLEPWVRFWEVWSAAAFLKSYLEASAGAPFHPTSRDEMARLLGAFLMDKAMYELGHELERRPEWVRIPLRGIVQLLETA
jgi:maltose alpha-D-glucosyltransferase / alpha-amylase